MAMAESGASPSPSSPLEENVASVAMAESGASPSPSSPLEKHDMTHDRTVSEAMDMDVNVAAVDASPTDEALNLGPNEAAVVTSLRDAVNMETKEMSLDESHRSETVTPSKEPLVSKGLNESRTELLERVQALKKDLENWRGRLDTQVKSYREELGDLRTSLNSEVEQLRVEFLDLRNTLKQQRVLTSTKLAKLDESSEIATNPKIPLPTPSSSTPFDTGK